MSKIIFVPVEKLYKIFNKSGENRVTCFKFDGDITAEKAVDHLIMMRIAVIFKSEETLVDGERQRVYALSNEADEKQKIVARNSTMHLWFIKDSPFVKLARITGPVRELSQQESDEKADATELAQLIEADAPKRKEEAAKAAAIKHEKNMAAKAAALEKKNAKLF